MILSKAEKVRLGVFLAVGFGLFFGSLILLAGLKLTEQTDTYFVRFHESVSGLEPSAQVRYQGLRVGSVARLSVDPKDPTAILVRLEIDPDTVLHEGTRAVLDMSGITGLKNINLQPGDPAKGVIEEGAFIPEEPSLIGRIGDRAELITERIERVTENLALWTGPDNRRRVEELLDNSNKLVTNVDSLVVDIRAPLTDTLTEVAKSGESIRAFAGEAAITMKDTRTELKGTLAQANGALKEVTRILSAVDDKRVRETVDSANSAMQALDKALGEEELAKAIVDLRESLVNVSRLATNLDLTVRASREDLTLALKYMRQAAEDLREFSRLIAQDPSVLVRGTETQE